MGNPQPEPRKASVLVVEDDRSSREALRTLLRLSGFDVRCAASVSEGIEQLNSPPHHLLLDLMLPDGSGATVLEHVRNQGLDTRVAVTTGASDWEQMLDVPRLRPDALFRKPVNLDGLLQWLRG